MNDTYAARMAPNTALALLLCGSTIFLASQWEHAQRNLDFIVMLAGSLMVAMAIIPLAGYLAGIDAAYNWGKSIDMAVHTAVCLLLLGSGILAYLWHESSGVPRRLPVSASLTMIVFTLAMAEAVRISEDTIFERNVKAEAEFTKKSNSMPSKKATISKQSSTYKNKFFLLFFKRYALVISIVVVTVFATAVGFAAYHQKVLMLEAEAWVVHTHQVIEHIDIYLEAANKISIGQKGYFLTGDAGYRELYESA